jgi:hypothetical protein
MLSPAKSSIATSATAKAKNVLARKLTPILGATTPRSQQ